MKKIGKLSINPEKVIKNEELVNLKGGYGDCSGGTAYICTCINSVGMWWTCIYSSGSLIDEIREWCASGEGTCVNVS